MSASIARWRSRTSGSLGLYERVRVGDIRARGIRSVSSLTLPRCLTGEWECSELPRIVFGEVETYGPERMEELSEGDAMLVNASSDSYSLVRAGLDWTRWTQRRRGGTTKEGKVVWRKMSVVVRLTNERLDVQPCGACGGEGLGAVPGVENEGWSSSKIMERGR